MGVERILRHQPPDRAPSKLSFTQQMLAIGRVPSSQALNIGIVPANAETLVIEITRLRLADNEPNPRETRKLARIGTD